MFYSRTVQLCNPQWYKKIETQIAPHNFESVANKSFKYYNQPPAIAMVNMSFFMNVAFHFKNGHNNVKKRVHNYNTESCVLFRSSSMKVQFIL